MLPVSRAWLSTFPRLHCRQGRQHQDQSHFVGLIKGCGAYRCMGE